MKAVVLLSGGLDSAVVAAIAAKQGLEVHALSIDYHQRHTQELEAATAIARSMQVPMHRIVLSLGDAGRSALTGSSEVPKDRPLDAPGVPSTYVPARNSIFLALAASLAESIGAGSIWIGANAVDYSGYPDCRPEFLLAFNRAINLGTVEGVLEGSAVSAPLVLSSKAEIIRLGRDLGVDFSLTHSCYDPVGGLACRHCDSCRIRAAGFEAAEVPDTTRYAPEPVP